MVTISPRIVQIIPAEGWRALFAIRSGEEDQTYTMPLACWALVEHSAEEFEEDFDDEEEYEEEEEDLDGEDEEEATQEEFEDEEDEESETLIYRAVEGVASFVGGGTCFVEDLPGYICYLEPGEEPAKRYQAMLDSGLLSRDDIPVQESQS